MSSSILVRLWMTFASQVWHWLAVCGHSRDIQATPAQGNWLDILVTNTIMRTPFSMNEIFELKGPEVYKNHWYSLHLKGLKTEEQNLISWIQFHWLLEAQLLSACPFQYSTTFTAPLIQPIQPNVVLLWWHNKILQNFNNILIICYWEIIKSSVKKHLNNSFCNLIVWWLLTWRKYANSLKNLYEKKF